MNQGALPSWNHPGVHLVNSNCWAEIPQK